MGIKVALEHRTSYTFDRLVEVYSARRAATAGAALPHADRGLLVAGRTGRPFRQLAAGRVRQLHGPPGVPDPARGLTITVGLIADLKIINPFDFFIEDYAEQIGFSYPKVLADDLDPYLRPVDEDDEGTGPGDLAEAWVKNFSVAPGTRTIDFLVALNRAVNADVGYSLRMEPGVQSPGFHVAHRHRIVPGLGVAARVDPAPDGAGRSLRLGLPGAADVRRRGTGRSVGADSGFHRSARLDRGVHPRRRLDRTGSHVRAVRRRGPHPALGDPAPRVRGADHRRDRTLRGDTGIQQCRHPGARGPARHAAVQRAVVGGDQRPRRTRRRAARRWRRSPHRRWRADLRVDRQSGRCRVDHRGGRPAQAATRLRAGGTVERGVGPDRSRAAQSGQVVPRRTVAALADRPAVASRRATAVARRVSAGRPLARTVRPGRRGTRGGPPGAGRDRRGTRPAGRPGASGLRGPAEPAGPRGAPARRRPRRRRKRPRRRHRACACGPAGAPRRRGHRTCGVRPAAAPP